MSDAESQVRELSAHLKSLIPGMTWRGAESLARPLVEEGWHKPPSRMQSLEAAQRADQDTGEMIEHLQRCQAKGGVHGTHEEQRVTAKRLVTWGWTRIGPGEQVVRRLTPRNEELSLRDLLTGTLIEFDEKDPVALAGQLIDEGWVKRNEDEFVISKEEMLLLVAAKSAFQRWERLKNTVREGAEVSRDESQLTSGVKPEMSEALVLAAFAGANRPLEFVEACDAAAGEKFPERAFTPWQAAFEALLSRNLIEQLPAAEGEIRRYQLTQAGRGLHELDGVDR